MYYSAPLLAMREPTRMPTMGLDASIPFCPSLAWLYCMQLVTTSLTAWLMLRYEHLISYFISHLALCVIIFSIFIAFPTFVPRPPPPTLSSLYSHIARIDVNGNAFPSFHAGFAVLCSGCLTATFPSTKRHLMVSFVSWLLTICVLYSALAIKQHVVLDIIGGILIGCLCWALFSHLIRERK